LACHLQIDADPDSAYHYDADPGPVFHFDADADPDTTFKFDADHADPDPQHKKSFNTLWVPWYRTLVNCSAKSNPKMLVRDTII
jgi:hypothetical protein